MQQSPLLAPSEQVTGGQPEKDGEAVFADLVRRRLTVSSP
jgi:hypothetical protein